MNILFTASECTPFVKTGGLADVAGSLPQILVEKYHHDVRVVLPLYKEVANKWKNQLKLISSFTVSLGWRNQQAQLYKMQHNQVIYYFIANEYYFERNDLYGYYDDGERFVFFCRAVIESLPYLDYAPDVVHSHDWQTGLIPAYLRISQPLPEVKTMFTIHNLKYQGLMFHDAFFDLMGLSGEHLYGLEWNGMINCMKAALHHSDILTTVSPSYAKEIQYPYYGEGLDPLLRERSDDLTGIINGIDTISYNPKTDSSLTTPFSHSHEKKAENKIALQKECGLPISKDTPMIAVISRLVEQKGLSLITRILEELLTEDVQLVILGTGDEEYENAFTNAAHKYPTKVSTHLYFNENFARQIYASSDLFLMPSRFEPCGLGQLLALRYESVPIVRETGGLQDTVIPFNEFNSKGNGFTFTNFNAHDMLHVIQYALSVYRSPRLWQKLLNNVYRSTYGWEKSAGQYSQLYTEMCQKYMVSKV